MRELDIDLASQAPEEAAARDAAPRRLGGHARLRRHLPLRARPSSRTGTSPTRPARRSTRSALIRDQIELRIEDLLEHRIDAIRADRTAHQLRLTRLLPGLIERFPDKPDHEIRACADAILAEYIDAPVRSFVMTIAERAARECLAQDKCAALA